MCERPPLRHQARPPRLLLTTYSHYRPDLLAYFSLLSLAVVLLQVVLPLCVPTYLPAYLTLTVTAYLTLTLTLTLALALTLPSDH